MATAGVALPFNLGLLAGALAGVAVGTGVAVWAGVGAPAEVPE